MVWSREGRRYLDRLQSLAAYLGETGQYPYGAMGEIAADVGRSDRKHAHAILREAIRFYDSDPGFITTNGEFVDFILKTHPVANRTILRTELNAAVHGLEHPRVSLPAQADFRISVTTSMGNGQFDSETDYLLFRLLPLIRLDNKQHGEEMTTAHPALERAPVIKMDTPVAMSGAVSPTGTASDERMQKALDRHRVFSSSQLANSDPLQARAIAEQITNPVLHDIALTSLAPAYHRVNAQQADSWLQKGNQDLATMPKSLTQLQLMVAVLKADVLMQREEAAQRMLPDAFKLAQQICADDLRQHPDKPMYAVDGIEELNELFKADVAIESETAVESVFRKSRTRCCAQRR